MNSAWTRHLQTEDEKTEFTRSLYSSRRVLERLRDIIKEEEEKLDSSEVTPKVYDNPSWAFLQAHKNGFRHCVKNLNRLLTLDQKDIHDRRPI